MSGETRFDANGTEIPVIRVVDSTVRVDATGARLNTARSWENGLPDEPGVIVRVGKITDYVANNIMVLDNDSRNAINLVGRQNMFNFIARETVGTATVTSRYWGAPTEPGRGWGHTRNTNVLNGLWYGALENNTEVRDWSHDTNPDSRQWANDRIDTRRFDELLRRALDPETPAAGQFDIWAIVYQANVVGNPLLSMSIVIDFVGMPARTFVASEILAEFARGDGFAGRLAAQRVPLPGELEDDTLVRVTNFVSDEAARVTKLRTDFDGLISAEKDIVVAAVPGVTDAAGFASARNRNHKTRKNNH
jgi:hypothetical protein